MIERVVGRGGELREIRELLESHRLVTLVGTGGVGKSTLARLVLRHYEGAFVSLESATDGSDVFGAVASALGLDGTPPEGVQAWLDDAGEFLLVVDNAEHVLEPTSSLLEEIFAAASELRVLVTSREPLGLSDERAEIVEPLGPDAAVELFYRRAEQHLAGWRESAIRPDVELLVSLLDRLPLAIELAAARIRIATPAQIVKFVERERDVLKTRAPGERHGSLQSCIAWSVDQMDDDLVEVFRQLAVFAGPFTVDDADAVVDGDEWVGDAVEELLQKSLLQTERTGEEVRFSLFDTVRRWVRANMPPSHEAYVRHAEWLRREFEAQRSGRYWFLVPQAATAFERVLDTDTELAIELALAAERPMRRSGALGRLNDIFDAIELSDVDLELRARVLTSKGSLYLSMAREEDALRQLELAEPLARQAQADELVARIFQIRGWMAHGAGQFEASIAAFDEAARHLPASPHPGLAAHVFGGAALPHLHLRKFDEAARLANIALEHARRSPDAAMRGRALSWVANVAAASGDLETARGLLFDARDEFESASDAFSLANQGLNLADLLLGLDASDDEIEPVLARAELAARRWGNWLAVSHAAAVRSRYSGDIELANRAVRQVRHLNYLTQRGIVLNLVLLLAYDGRWERALKQLEAIIEAADAGDDDAETRWLQRYGVAIRAMAGDASGALAAEPDAGVRNLLQSAFESGDVSSLQSAYLDPYLRCEYGFPDEPLRLLRRAVVAPTLKLDSEGVVSLPDGETIDLATRTTLLRFLRFMASRHAQDPGATIPIEALIEGGWPTEVLTWDSGKQRVYAAVKQLRALGLEDIIETGDGGYALRSDLRVLVSDES